jgi:hypothetical protein
MYGISCRICRKNDLPTVRSDALTRAARRTSVLGFSAPRCPQGDTVGRAYARIGRFAVVTRRQKNTLKAAGCVIWPEVVVDRSQCVYVSCGQRITDKADSYPWHHSPGTAEALEPDGGGTALSNSRRRCLVLRPKAFGGAVGSRLPTAPGRCQYVHSSAEGWAARHGTSPHPRRQAGTKAPSPRTAKGGAGRHQNRAHENARPSTDVLPVIHRRVPPHTGTRLLGTPAQAVG